MSSTPLVSVIVIFLNGEPFLVDAIESVYAQTYGNWEILLVDDGSTDGSTELAQRYANQYPERVRYLEHDGHHNMGMSASRNLGILQARGDFIGFLDADDIWLPQKLEEQIALFTALPEAGMVYGRTLIWHSWAPPEDKTADYFYKLGIQPNRLVKPPCVFNIILQNRYQTPTTCNALMRRSVFSNVGMFEESFRSMYEDQVFFSKVTLSVPVYVADKCWAKYRQHPQSCSMTSQGQDYFKGRESFLNWLERYCRSQAIEDRSLLQQIRWELWKCCHPRLAILIEKIRVTLNRLMEPYKRFHSVSTQLHHQ